MEDDIFGFELAERKLTLFVGLEMEFKQPDGPDVDDPSELSRFLEFPPPLRNPLNPLA